MLAQLATNLKPLPPAKPLQPSKGKANESQSQTQTQTQTTLSQKITEIPYFKEYCFLLDSLASIRSVVLVWEVPGGEELVTSFFEGFVSIVR
jgi:sister-chromatid-cohesion protein PDS5